MKERSSAAKARTAVCRCLPAFASLRHVCACASASVCVRASARMQRRARGGEPRFRAKGSLNADRRRMCAVSLGGASSSAGPSLRSTVLGVFDPIWPMSERKLRHDRDPLVRPRLRAARHQLPQLSLRLLPSFLLAHCELACGVLGSCGKSVLFLEEVLEGTDAIVSTLRCKPLCVHNGLGRISSILWNEFTF